MSTAVEIQIKMSWACLRSHVLSPGSHGLHFSTGFINRCGDVTRRRQKLSAENGISPNFDSFFERKTQLVASWQTVAVDQKKNTIRNPATIISDKDLRLGKCAVASSQLFLTYWRKPK